MAGKKKEAPTPQPLTRRRARSTTPSDTTKAATAKHARYEHARPPTAPLMRTRTARLAIALEPPTLCRAPRGAARPTTAKCYELAKLPNRLFKDTQAVGGPQSAAAVELLQLGFSRTEPKKINVKTPRGKVDILWCILENDDWRAITR